MHGREYAELGLSLAGRRQQRYRQVIIDIKDAVAGYTLGNIVSSLLATVATWIVLSILGVPTRWRSASWWASKASSIGADEGPARSQAHAGPTIRTQEQRGAPR